MHAVKNTTYTTKSKIFPFCFFTRRETLSKDQLTLLLAYCKVQSGEKRNNANNVDCLLIFTTCDFAMLKPEVYPNQKDAHKLYRKRIITRRTILQCLVTFIDSLPEKRVETDISSK